MLFTYKGKTSWSKFEISVYEINVYVLINIKYNLKKQLTAEKSISGQAIHFFCILAGEKQSMCASYYELFLLCVESLWFKYTFQKINLEEDEEKKAGRKTEMERRYEIEVKSR